MTGFYSILFLLILEDGLRSILNVSYKGRFGEQDWEYGLFSDDWLEIREFSNCISPLLACIVLICPERSCFYQT